MAESGNRNLNDVLKAVKQGPLPELPENVPSGLVVVKVLPGKDKGDGKAEKPQWKLEGSTITLEKKKVKDDDIQVEGDYKVTLDGAVGPKAAHADLFERANIATLLDAAIHGVNAVLLSYGTSSTAKSAVLFGSDLTCKSGVVGLLLRDLHEKIECEREDGADVRLRLAHFRIADAVPLDMMDLLKLEGRKGAEDKITEIEVPSTEKIGEVLGQTVPKTKVDDSRRAKAEQPPPDCDVVRIVIERHGGGGGPATTSYINILNVPMQKPKDLEEQKNLQKKESQKILKLKDSVKNEIVKDGSGRRRSASGGDMQAILAAVVDNRTTKILRPTLGSASIMSVVCCVQEGKSKVEDGMACLQMGHRLRQMTAPFPETEGADADSFTRKYVGEIERMKEQQRVLQTWISSSEIDSRAHARVFRWFMSKRKVDPDDLKKMDEATALENEMYALRKREEGAASDEQEAITVLVRIRPLNMKELMAGDKVAWKWTENTVVPNADEGSKKVSERGSILNMKAISGPQGGNNAANLKPLMANPLAGRGGASERDRKTRSASLEDLARDDGGLASKRSHSATPTDFGGGMKQRRNSMNSMGGRRSSASSGLGGRRSSVGGSSGNLKAGSSGTSVGDIGEKSYTVERVYGPTADTDLIYQEKIKSKILEACRGVNATIFAYGQTASGKTFSMLGSPTQPGVIPMALQDVFDTVTVASSRQYLIRVSYFEIYNEVISDLLAPPTKSGDKGVKVEVQQSADGITISGMREEVVCNADQVLFLLELGQKTRKVGSTDMNAKSSRSHTIFRMVIESKDRSAARNTSAVKTVTDGPALLTSINDQTEPVRFSTLALVDLAGSERVSQTNATGERLKEGAFINKSLMALGAVIKAISEGNENKAPFRDSNLTRILQPSLGGNARTVVVCTMSPAAVNVGESLGTLFFAMRAKKIVNKTSVNKTGELEKLRLRAYQQQMAEVTREVKELRRYVTSARACRIFVGLLGEVKVLAKRREAQAAEEKVKEEAERKRREEEERKQKEEEMRQKLDELKRRKEAAEERKVLEEEERKKKAEDRLRAEDERKKRREAIRAEQERKREAERERRQQKDNVRMQQDLQKSKGGSDAAPAKPAADEKKAKADAPAPAKAAPAKATPSKKKTKKMSKAMAMLLDDGDDEDGKSSGRKSLSLSESDLLSRAYYRGGFLSVEEEAKANENLYRANSLGASFGDQVMAAINEVSLACADANLPISLDELGKASITVDNGDDKKVLVLDIQGTKVQFTCVDANLQIDYKPGVEPDRCTVRSFAIEIGGDVADGTAAHALVAPKVPTTIDRMFLRTVTSSAFEAGYFVIIQYCSEPTLWDVLERYIRAKKLMDEMLVCNYTVEMLRILGYLHENQIVHGDVNGGNFMLRDTGHGLSLVDVGSSVDLSHFKPGTCFKGPGQSPTVQCVEMMTGRPWTYQIDTFGMLMIIHGLLFGRELDVYEEALDDGTTEWRAESNFSTLKCPHWKPLFDALLNVKNCDKQPNLIDFMKKFKKYLDIDPEGEKMMKFHLKKQEAILMD